MAKAKKIEEKVFAVFVHPRRGNPKRIGEFDTASKPIPSTWEHNGKTLFFACADLSARTMTYTNVRPVPAQ
jgi:hypothetical protein